MRVGQLKLLPYVRLGDERMGGMIRDLAGYAAVLLVNPGPVVAGRDLSSAVYAAEELEETAKLLILLRDASKRMLPADNVAVLQDQLRQLLNELHQPVVYSPSTILTPIRSARVNRVS